MSCHNIGQGLNEVVRNMVSPRFRTIAIIMIKGHKMKNPEIVDLLPLHRQMTLVIFRDPDTRKCEVQILPVSLETTELKALQEMLKIPTEPEADAATVSFEVEEALSREVLDWCEARDITSEQLVRAFICFCGKMKNVDMPREWIRQEIAQQKIDIEKLPSVTRVELEQDVDAIMERVEAGESPILSFLSQYTAD